MFSIQNSIPQKGTINISVEIARLESFEKEFNNALNLFSDQDMFRYLCFDEPVRLHIMQLKHIISSVGRIADARKKKNIIGYFYVCLTEMSYFLFKLGETLSSPQGQMNTAKFYEYVRLSMEYRAEEWKLVDAGRNLKEIDAVLGEKKGMVELARTEMESAICLT